MNRVTTARGESFQEQLTVLCFFAKAPLEYAADSIARKPSYTFDFSASRRECARLRRADISSSLFISDTIHLFLSGCRCFCVFF